MVEHELVRDSPHGPDPIPVSWRSMRTWRAILFRDCANVRPWRIDLWKAMSDETEDGEIKSRNNGRGNEGCS
jgi:hypothetical protein